MLTADQEKEVEEMMDKVGSTLLDWMFSLTPLEPLRVHENYAETFWSVQGASQIAHRPCGISASIHLSFPNFTIFSNSLKMQNVQNG